MPINTLPKKYLSGDLSLWILLLINLITILFAVTEHWNLLIVMWIYWFQSVTIGLFNFIRILQLKKFSALGVSINGVPAQQTLKTKIHTAFFFLFHYGIFHVRYFFFDN